MQMTREGYQAKVERHLKQWVTQFEALQEKTKKSGADTKDVLLTDIAELRNLQWAGRQHLKTIQSVAASNWDDVKTDLTDKWSRVSGAVDAVFARAK